MKFARGQSGNPAGRRRGSANKTTAAIKDILQGTFERIGGEEALAKWARDNPGEFYGRLWVKLLPRDVAANQSITGEQFLERMLAARERALAMRKKIMRVQDCPDIGDR